MATPVVGLRFLALLVLGLGFLARVLAFDNTKKDNVRIHLCGSFLRLISQTYSWPCQLPNFIPYTVH